MAEGVEDALKYFSFYTSLTNMNTLGVRCVTHYRHQIFRGAGLAFLSGYEHSGRVGLIS